MSDALPQRPAFLPEGFGTTGHQDFVEIIPPPPVSYAPQTWGWWAMGGLVVAAALVTAWRAQKRYRANAYRRLALVELGALQARLPQERAEALSGLPGLLKRAALAGFPRVKVASLSGESWWAFLESTAPGAIPDDSKRELGRMVVEGAQVIPAERDGALFEAVEEWIRRHHA